MKFYLGIKFILKQFLGLLLFLNPNCHLCYVCDDDISKRNTICRVCVYILWPCLCWIHFKGRYPQVPDCTRCEKKNRHLSTPFLLSSWVLECVRLFNFSHASKIQISQLPTKQNITSALVIKISPTLRGGRVWSECCLLTPNIASAHFLIHCRKIDLSF